ASMSWITGFDFLQCERVQADKGKVQVCKDTLSSTGWAQIGTVRDVGGFGRWFLDSDGSHGWSGGDRTEDFGLATDVPLVTNQCSGSSKNAVRLAAVRRESAGLKWFYTNRNFDWDGHGGFLFGATN